VGERILTNESKLGVSATLRNNASDAQYRNRAVAALLSTLTNDH